MAKIDSLFMTKLLIIIRFGAAPTYIGYIRELPPPLPLPGSYKSDLSFFTISSLVYTKISRRLPNITEDYKRISEIDIENFEQYYDWFRKTGTKYNLSLMPKLTVPKVTWVPLPFQL